MVLVTRKYGDCASWISAQSDGTYGVLVTLATILIIGGNFRAVAAQERQSQSGNVVEFPRHYTAKLVFVDADDPASEDELFQAPRPLFDGAQPARGRIGIPPDSKVAMMVLSEDDVNVDLSP